VVHENQDDTGSRVAGVLGAHEGDVAEDCVHVFAVHQNCKDQEHGKHKAESDIVEADSLDGHGPQHKVEGAVGIDGNLKAVLEEAAVVAEVPTQDSLLDSGDIPKVAADSWGLEVEVAQVEDHTL
jgi:hypothetical protein